MCEELDPEEDNLKQYFHSLALALSIIFHSFSANAGFMEDHVAPTFSKAADETSLSIWMAGIASVIAVHQLDHQLKEDWGQHQVMPAWQSNIGDRYISYGANIAIAQTQYFLDKENGLSHIKALLFTTGVTQVVKVTAQRERPDNSDRYSFPSGHTSAAFATATSLSYAYGWKAGVPAYAMAIFTGISRIADDKHWASDVVAGAVLGMVWGRATYPNKNELHTQGESNLMSEVFPSYERGVFAMNFVREF